MVTVGFCAKRFYLLESEVKFSKASYDIQNFPASKCKHSEPGYVFRF